MNIWKVWTYFGRYENLGKWKTQHEWRCISYWTWGISNVILVFRGVKVALPSSELTCHWNPVFNRRYIFKRSTFCCHVSLLESNKKLGRGHRKKYMGVWYMIFFATLMGSSLLFWWVLLVASKRSTLLQKSKINLNAFLQRHTETDNSKRQPKEQHHTTKILQHVYLYTWNPNGGPLFWLEFFFLFWGVDLQKQRSIEGKPNPNFLHPKTPRFTMQNRGAGLKVSSWWRILAEAWKTKFISINLESP